MQKQIEENGHFSKCGRLALINSLMNEWNKCDIIDYLKRVYLYLDKELFNTLLIDNTLLIVHTCCAYFMKRVSYMHKKFPKCIEV